MGRARDKRPVRLVFSQRALPKRNTPNTSYATNSNKTLDCHIDCGELIYECWREWGSRIWNVQLLPELEEGVQILLAEFPGDRPEYTEEALNAPGKPTLAQLGL